MSIDAMRWAKKVKTGKSSSKAILTWLADMCGADLCAYPSVAALAEATEMDRKTVLAGLQHLQDKALSRFTAALEQARAEGFRGPQALNRAHAILWPQPATSIIDEAMHDDDVDFVEQSVLQALDINDPVYIVGLQYYTTRKKISDITRELQSIAPWLTDWEARKRVRWCLEIFRAKVFLSTRKLLAEQS